MLILGITLTPVSAEDQPQPGAIIDLLQAAKRSSDPVPLLQDARKQLKNATGIKGSVRLEAQQLIKEAIAEAQTGTRRRWSRRSMPPLPRSTRAWASRDDTGRRHRRV